MYAKVTSLGVTGLAGYIVQVEADLSGGLPQFNLVGLPDSAVQESSERVRSAIKNLHYEWPASRITINLAPADVRKTGPVYDLPVFVGIMAAQGKLPAPGSERAFLGELGLDGTLRPVTGVLPMALAAVQNGVKELFLPAENAAIKHQVHPKKWTYENIDYMRAELKGLGLSFSTKRDFATCDAEYTKFEQDRKSVV